MTVDSGTSPPGAISAAKRLLLERRLRGLADGADPARISRRATTGPAPLSPAQHGVWLAEQLQSATALYGVYRALWLRGDLDVDSLRSALDELVRRHEILRTTYESTEAGPVQVVAAPGSAELTVVTVAGDSAAKRRAEAIRLAETTAAEPFDLVTGPLFAASVAAVCPDEHLLVLRMHHLLTDEWSCGLLLRELADLYSAYRRRSAGELPEPPLQYSDYATWLAEPEQVEHRRRQTDFWVDVLAQVPPVLELPTDRIRPDVPSYQGAVERIRLSPEASAGLRALASKYGTTMFGTLLALFGVVLGRYSGQERFAVGSLLSGRGRPETEAMIGMFASTVAIPLDLTGEPSFGELLARTRAAVLGALDHQDATFDQVVTELQLPRESSRNPLFQVLFQSEEADEREHVFDGLECEPVRMDTGQAKVDLTLLAVNHPDSVSLELAYATDLYRPETASRLLNHLSNLVDAAVTDPNAGIVDADMLTAAERQTTVVEWNATQAPYPKSATVHELFERWAAEAPDRPAIWRPDGDCVTYGDLNTRANRLAHYLRARGVGLETFVGVCVDHSVEMFVALLGVLKAGAAYVPLDTALPGQRIAWILEDTAMPLVVTTEALRGTLPETFDKAVIPVDSAWPTIADCPAHNPEPLSDADNLLYVIYTSGSTGRPKGVLVPHRGVVNYLWWAIEQYGLEGERGAVMVGSIAFDLSVPNFWLPLIGGKCVTLLPADKNLEHLADLLREPGDFSLLKITPGHLDVLRSMLEPGSVDSVRTYVVGADEVRPETVSGWRKTAPLARIINEYGPTETVVGCSIYTVPDDFDASVSVSIGKPIDNLRMYVLDRGLNPVPVGVTGELYIGGHGVVRGYLNRAALTAEKFVPDPYGEPGDRMYRTGDLARYRANGDFEFLGRTDFQVKIRGYRIELGEVEARLGLHPGVAEAVAVAVSDKNGHKRLAGYLVPVDATAPPTPSELRQYMAEGLPEYMVPAVFTVLDAMPLTSAGKIDRTALPEPSKGRSTFEAARTAAERTFAGIWGEVLGVPRVGVRDNFFELGGDSILAIKVTSRARDAGLSLPPAALFRHQTVAELATAATKTAADPADAARQDPAVGDMPLTPAQYRFVDTHVPGDEHSLTTRIEYPSPPDPADLRSALRTLVDRHDALRLRLVRGQNGWRQFVAEPADADVLRQVDLAGLDEDAADAETAGAIALARGSLDPAAGPLLRAVLLQRGGRGRDELVIVAHRVAVDSASWNVLLEDLVAARQGRDLPEPPTSFQHWSRRLAEYANSPEFAAEIDFWRTTAAELAAVPPIPTDHPRDMNRPTDTAAAIVRLSAEETAALAAQARIFRAGLDELLLTALARAAAVVWGDAEFAVDVETSGRENPFDDFDLSRTVGCFADAHPVVLRLAGDRPGDWVGSAKDRLRQATQGGIGYGLARYLSTDTAWPGAGRPQIKFGYHAAAAGVETSDAEHALPHRPPYLLDVTARLHDGKLRIDWTYRVSCHDGATVDRLVQTFEETLTRLASTGAAEGGVAASDFPLAELSPDGFAALTDLDEIADVFRLTPLQTGMLYQTAAQPDRGDYVGQFIYRLNEPVDSTALRSAWRFVVNRHAALRTSFAWRGLPHPVQLVHGKTDLDWTDLDWRDLPDAEVARRLAAECRRPIPLDAGPPQCFQLIRLGERSYRLVWRFHHILLDGWSMPIVLDEVLAAYRALTEGRPIPDLPAPTPFREHIAWLAGQRGEASAEFWRSALAGVDGPTPIPAVGPETDEDDVDVRAVRASLGRVQAERLVAFARERRVTLGTVLQAAWALLLARESGRPDVVFGTVTAGRSAQVQDDERMVGMLMNTLPARVTVADVPVGDWLRSVHAAFGAFREHEYVALGDVRRAARIPANRPLFDSIFVYENFSLPDMAVEDGHFFELVEANQRTGYPLVLNTGLHGQLQVDLTYDRFRVGDDDAKRLVDAYMDILGRMLDPDVRIVDLAPTGSAEAVAAVPIPRKPTAPVRYEPPRDATERTLVELWSDVLEVPRVGIRDDFFDLGGDSILAMQVVARARDLGMELRPRDVFRFPTVGEVAGRTAGREAAALPLAPRSAPDVTLVADRFATGTVEAVHSLAPLQTGILFQVLGELSSSDYVQVFAYQVDGVLDETAFRAAWQSVVDRHAALRTVFAWEGLARPVQVVLRASVVETRTTDLTHANVDDRQERLRRLISDEQATPIDLSAQPPTRITMVRMGPDSWAFLWRTHHIALDGASVPMVLNEVFDTYRSLAVGEAAVERPAPVSYGDCLPWIVNRDDASDRDYWGRLLTGFDTPTPLPAGSGAGSGAGVRRTETPGTLADGLRRLAQRHRITVGAVLHGAWALLLARHSGDDDVVFGTTVTGRSVPVPGVERMIGMLMNTLPIRLDVRGRGSIVDWLREVHQSLAELREYEHSPLTDVQRCSEIPAGQRMFDSILVFHNVRHGDAKPPAGVSPVANDSAISTGYPLVLDAVWHDGLHLQLSYGREHYTDADTADLLDQYVALLRAVVADTDDSPASVAERTLRTVSPAPSSPAAAPAHANAEGYLALRGDTEQALADIWKDVLGLDQVGAADNFFDLGGDSILAIQIVSQARKAGLRLTTKQVFANHTVAELARVALPAEETAAPRLREESPVTGVDQSELDGWLTDSDPEDVYPLSTMQAGMLFHTLYEPAGNDYHEQFVVTLRGELDLESFTRAWQHVVQRHPVLRSTFIWDASQPVQVVHRAATVDVVHSDWSELTPAELETRFESWLAVERTRGFDLRTEPPHRFDLIRTGPSRHRFVWQYHHLQLDGWSTSTVLAEMFEVYEALRHTGAVPTREAPPRFGDYVAWQRRQDPARNRQYWRERLAGLSTPTPLPLDRPDAHAGETGTRTLTAPTEVVERLREIGRRERVTMGAVLHAAWALLLARYSRQDDVLFGTTLTGRSADLPGIENMVGMLMTTLPLRVPVDPAQELSAYLREVHDKYVTLREYEHSALTDVQRCSEIPAGQRMFDSIFVYQNFEPDEPQVTGLRIQMHDAYEQTGYPLLCAASLSTDLSLKVNYQRGRISDGTAERVLENLVEILRGIAAEPRTVGGVTSSVGHELTPTAEVDQMTSPAPSVPAVRDTAPAPSQSRAEQIVAEVWTQVLDLPGVDTNDDFFELGGDSILAIRVVSLARQAGMRLTLRDVFERRTLGELAAAAHLDTPSRSGDGTAQGPVSGSVELTPIQRWFADLDVPHDHYNQTTLLRARRTVDARVLRKALDGLVHHHDALRSRLVRDDRGWHQHVAPNETADLLREVDLCDAADPVRAAADATTAANASLDLRDGPMIRAVLLHGEDTDTVLIAAHHLAVDTVSWGILQEDLNTAYAQVRSGETVALPAKTTSYQHWAQRLAEHTRSDEFAPEAAYWRNRPVPSVTLPVDRDAGPNTEGDTNTVAVTLSADTTRALLRQASKAYRTGVNDLLLAALALTLRDWTGRAEVRIDVEGHGREALFDDVDLSRTVGWFTVVRPVEVRLDTDEAGAAIRIVQEKLRAVPHNGIGYGLARRLGSDTEDAFGDGQLLFNYHGQQTNGRTEQFFQPCDGPQGVARNPLGVRPYLLEVDAAVLDGEFHVEWKYSTRRHDEATVAGLAEDYLARLRAVVDHCVSSTRTRRSALVTDTIYPGSPTLSIPLTRRQVPGMSAATIRDGELADVWCHGTIDGSEGGRVQCDTPFQAGSISKLVTAVGVLRLAQQGIVDLDENVDRYLTEWRVGQPVTIRQLIAHTAGLTVTGYDGYRPGEPVPTLLDVLAGRHPANTPAVRAEQQPGVRQRYSGSHYTVLQQLTVSVVDGSFPDIMRSLVLDPLNMNHSGYNLPDAVPAGAIAAGHDHSGHRYPERWRVLPEMAAAGLWTTPQDLVRLLGEARRAHLEHDSRLLTRESARTLLYPVGGDRDGTASRRLRVDSGGTPGYMCLVLYELHHGSGAVVMTNADGGLEAIHEVCDVVLNSFDDGDRTGRRTP